MTCGFGIHIFIAYAHSPRIAKSYNLNRFWKENIPGSLNRTFKIGYFFVISAWGISVLFLMNYLFFVIACDFLSSRESAAFLSFVYIGTFVADPVNSFTVI